VLQLSDVDVAVVVGEELLTCNHKVEACLYHLVIFVIDVDKVDIGSINVQRMEILSSSEFV